MATTLYTGNGSKPMLPKIPSWPCFKCLKRQRYNSTAEIKIVQKIFIFMAYSLWKPQILNQKIRILHEINLKKDFKYRNVGPQKSIIMHIVIYTEYHLLNCITEMNCCTIFNFFEFRLYVLIIELWTLPSSAYWLANMFFFFSKISPHLKSQISTT